MSYGFKFVGNASAVAAKVREFDAHLIAEEHAQLEAAKAAIGAALDATDPNQGVIVEASGHAWTESSYSKKGCSFSAKVETVTLVQDPAPTPAPAIAQGDGDSGDKHQETTSSKTEAAPSAA